MVATTLRRGESGSIGVDTEDTGSPARDSITIILLAPVAAGTVIRCVRRQRWRHRERWRRYRSVGQHLHGRYHGGRVDLNAGTAGVNDTNLYGEGSFDASIGTDIAVTDADGDMIQSATVTITDAIAGDLLVANLPLPGGITISGASTATTLILTGAASAAYRPPNSS